MVGPALITPFFNIYFAREHGMPLEGIGLVFAVGQWLAALAVLVSGELATRFGLRRILATTLVFFAPAVWGLTLTTAIQLAVGLYFVQGLVSPVTNPLIDQLLFRLTPTERHGLVSSWRNAAADVSAMVGASTGGVLLAGETFALLFVTAGIVGLVGALVLVVGLRRLEYNVFDE
jgi:MFS family permease